MLPDIVANEVAVFLVGGWHDAFQRGAPLNYAALQNAFAGRPDEQPMQPGQPVSERMRLMMGPWYHVSDFGGLHLHALQLRWFDHWLNDDAAAAISGSPFTFQAIGSPRWFHAREYPLRRGDTDPILPVRVRPADRRVRARNAPRRRSNTWARGPVAGRSVEQWTLGHDQLHPQPSAAGNPLRPGQPATAARRADLHHRTLRHPDVGRRDRSR